MDQALLELLNPLVSWPGLRQLAPRLRLEAFEGARAMAALAGELRRRGVAHSPLPPK